MREDIFLGIDTSCYTTSVAACNKSGEMLLFKKQLLDVKQGERGLRQSEAVFSHIKNLNEIFKKNDISKLGSIKAVCASCTPRPQANSYMPVFVVSETLGRSVASSCGAAFYSSTHQQGHVYAAKIGNSIGERFIGIHLSGGTSEVLLWKGENISVVGKTLDIAAGQVIDRLGTAAGLPFPSGKYLEQQAQESTEDFHLKTTVKGCDFSFSGVEAQCLRLLSENKNKADIFASCESAVARTVFKAVKNCCEEKNIKECLFFGGVISNEKIKQIIDKNLKKFGIKCSFAKREYSSDNSAGLALYAKDKFIKENEL